MTILDFILIVFGSISVFLMLLFAGRLVGRFPRLFYRGKGRKYL